jgi:hypothetical protein
VNAVPKNFPKVAVGGAAPEMNTGKIDDSKENVEATPEARLPFANISTGIDIARLAIRLDDSGSSQSVIAKPRTETNFDLIDGLEPGDLVVGLSLGGKSRAYLVKQLAVQSQSVVNDQLDGRPIGLTWNSANRTAAAFVGHASDLNLTFRAAGKTWKSDLVFQDKETESIWSQVMGLCVEGQLRGTALDVLPAVVTTWGHWKKSCPKTELVVLDQTIESVEPFTGKFSAANPRQNSISAAFVDGKFEVVDRKKLLDERVVNTKVGDQEVVLFYDVDADGVHGFQSRVGLRALTFEWRGTIFVDQSTETVWDINTGLAADGLMAQSSLTPIVVIETTAELWGATRPK